MVKILVPTDYSRCSLTALRHATSLTREANGSLLIVHVQEPPSAYVWLDALRVARRSTGRQPAPNIRRSATVSSTDHHNL